MNHIEAMKLRAHMLRCLARSVRLATYTEHNVPWVSAREVPMLWAPESLR